MVKFVVLKHFWIVLSELEFFNSSAIKPIINFVFIFYWEHNGPYKFLSFQRTWGDCWHLFNFYLVIAKVLNKHGILKHFKSWFVIL